MQERPFTLHTRADFTPAACVVSGRSENLIDLGAEDIPGYGRLYIDTITFAELASAMGLVDGRLAETQTNTLRKEIAQLQAHHAATELQVNDHIADLQDQIRILKLAPNRAALKEFQDGINSMVSGLADRLFRPSDGVPDILVPANEQIPVVSDIGAVGSSKRAVPRRGKPKPKPVASEPEITVGDNDAGTVGDSKSEPASPAIGGPELHESFDWDEPADRDSEPNFEGFFDPDSN